jgi:hypothetical protein
MRSHAPPSHSLVLEGRTKHIRGYAHSGFVHATDSVLQAQCAMRFAGRCMFLAHPRQILTQSFEDKSTRPVAGAAELFYAKALVALPFSSGFPPFICLAACWLRCNIHTPCHGPVSTLLTTQVPSWTHYAL